MHTNYNYASLNTEILRRICSALMEYVDDYITQERNHPNELVERHNVKINIGAMIEFCTPSEKMFIGWLTSGKDASYYSSGLYSNHSNAESYPTALYNLRTAFSESNPDTFFYIVEEYKNMQKAQIFQENDIRDREYRTCEICETRFETVEGMHRHQSKCKGTKELTFKEKLLHPAYRGDYKPKQSKAHEAGWTDGQTSTW